MGDNRYLHAARIAKDDEFYTTYEAVAEELRHYERHFRNKTVLCNCDDPFESNFCRFFLRNFNHLRLRRLICTAYAKSEIAEARRATSGNQSHEQGVVLDVNRKLIGLGELTDAGVDWFLEERHGVRSLNGDGDFRSVECLRYMDEADIIVTNPPFSLFKQLVAVLQEKRKRFLLVGNQNALTYKEIFPLLQRNEVWTGYCFGDMKFRVPNTALPRKTRYWVDESGQKWRSLGNAMWLTNLDNARRHEWLKLTKRYAPDAYREYDDYKAIHINRVADIPVDYPGVMGVPITIVDKYNAEQFEIVGEANHGSDSEYDLFKPTIGGKLMFKRILVRHRRPPEKDFRILDLFSGAGGFSYGLEMNPRFKTVVALDMNEAALRTFSANMPDAKTVCGDITDEGVKQRVVALSREGKVNMIVGGPPCQGFSLKGKKLGLEDPRNYLFREYLNLVSSLQPEVFVIENVKALLSTSSGWFRRQIEREVVKLGYQATAGVLTASDFGVPQVRQRAIFICAKNRKISLPTRTSERTMTVRDAISDLAYLNSGEGSDVSPYRMDASCEYQRHMREGSEALHNHKASNHAAIAVRKLSMIPPERGKECLPAKLLGKQKFSGTWGRLKWDSPSPTIDTRFDAASNGTNNHPCLNRAITPREAARLQSFPDRFVFVGSKVAIRQQIGNAVPPLMAKAIADQICKEEVSS